MSEINTCSKCRKPKTSEGSGIVTQFIEICRCNELSVEQSQTIKICSICNKRIPSNSGSMTQWIFGREKCVCEKPEPQLTPIEQFVNPAFIGFRNSKEETYLELDSDKFPVERYLPIEKLGTGAIGVVYLSRDKVLDKKVAVKTLLELTGDQLISFQEEAKATAKLDHPGIVKIIDFGASETGTPYMVMDYIPGISLERYLKDNGTLTENQASAIFSKLAEALDYAHEQQVYHRDIKPSNILLYEKEEEIEVCLIDFGIAKVKETSGLVNTIQEKTLAGTPAYMCPDPLIEETYDEISEVYCLGCVLFEALAGTPPYKGKSALDTFYMHSKNDLPNLIELNPMVSIKMSNLVSNCLKKNRAYRISSMKELKYQLNSASATETAIESSTHKHSTLKYRNSLIVPLTLIALILTTGAFFIYNTSKSPLPELAKVRIGNISDASDPKLTKEIYDEKKQLTEKDIKALLINETQLKLKGYLFSGELFSNLSGKFRETISNKKLKSIEFSYCTFSKGSLDELCKHTELNSLAFLDCELESSELKCLSKLNDLKRLSLQGLALDLDSINNIGSISSLNYLRLSRCQIKNDSQSNQSSLDGLGGLKNLRELATYLSLTKKASLNFVSKLTGLEKIYMRNSSSYKYFPDLKHLKSLNHITLENFILNNENMKRLASASALRSLHLKNCKLISPLVFDELSNAKSLTDLSLRNCAIDQNSRAGFAKLDNLKFLKIVGNEIGLFRYLPKLKLVKLAILNNDVLTEDILLNASEISTLRNLQINYCINISGAFQKKFRKQNKNCHINIRNMVFDF